MSETTQIVTMIDQPQSFWLRVFDIQEVAIGLALAVIGGYLIGRGARGRRV